MLARARVAPGCGPCLSPQRLESPAARFQWISGTSMHIVGRQAICMSHEPPTSPLSSHEITGTNDEQVVVMDTPYSGVELLSEQDIDPRFFPSRQFAAESAAPLAEGDTAPTHFMSVPVREDCLEDVRAAYVLLRLMRDEPDNPLLEALPCPLCAPSAAPAAPQ
eukprot:gnl/Chilomastix_cuspidata/5892.p2 GENE.gnl/Chilomastix_cuspidata/5892~~gnl/Chilomastix_cuspidata/5892.p2  ORF type:complete len:164 (-),score=26.53 gnl/Chilomastix_cuspidata/5892:59-550(-)